MAEELLLANNGKLDTVSQSANQNAPKKLTTLKKKIFLKHDACNEKLNLEKLEGKLKNFYVLSLLSVCWLTSKVGKVCGNPWHRQPAQPKHAL